MFFPSIDHGILEAKLRARIKDAPVLALLDRLDKGRRLGNFASC